MSIGIIRFEDVGKNTRIKVETNLIPQPKMDAGLTPAQCACLGFSSKIMEVMKSQEAAMIEMTEEPGRANPEIVLEGRDNGEEEANEGVSASPVPQSSTKE